VLEQFGFGAWWAVKVSLGGVTSVAAQELGLLGGLNAFGDNADAQRLADAESGTKDGVTSGIDAETRDE
jgi:hypothetical protein